MLRTVGNTSWTVDRNVQGLGGHGWYVLPLRIAGDSSIVDEQVGSHGRLKKMNKGLHECSEDVSSIELSPRRSSWGSSSTEVALGERPILSLMMQ